MKIGRMVDLGG